MKNVLIKKSHCIGTQMSQIQKYREIVNRSFIFLLEAAYFQNLQLFICLMRYQSAPRWQIHSMKFDTKPKHISIYISQRFYSLLLLNIKYKIQLNWIYESSPNHANSKTTEQNVISGHYQEINDQIIYTFYFQFE